jgi:prepilin-type N-terminal cleavage/methylation domain-containing protein
MKRGFTLIELLVYMAIMGFIIVVAGRVFSDSTVMRVRSQNMIKTAEEVGKIANLISEDISQTGVKAWGEENASGDYKIYNTNNAPSNAITTEVRDVYMSVTGTNPNSHDSSSFRILRGTTYDSIFFRKVEFNTDGKYLGVREIFWLVNDNKQLFRGCRTVSGNADAANVCPKKDKFDEGVLVADNIKKFSLSLSRPGVLPIGSVQSINKLENDLIDFPPTTASSNAFKLISNIPGVEGNRGRVSVSYNDNSTTASVTGFVTNFSPNATNSKRFNEVYLGLGPDITQTSSCLDVRIQKGETYVVEFDMPFPTSEADIDARDARSSQFLPGVDHIAIGLRDGNGNSKPIDGISSDVLLYAPQSGEAVNKPRHAEFTANDKFDRNNVSKVCVALTFSFYSPLANQGVLKFSNFKVFKKATGAYHFVKEKNDDETDRYPLNDARKYAADAVEGIANNDLEKLVQKKNVKAIELLLEISINGEVAGTYSKGSTGMAIPVPNNGATSL